MNDALQQEAEERSMKKEMERRLEAMKAECLKFADKYLEASTTQEQSLGEYKERVHIWQGKVKDLKAEREGLQDTIADQRKRIEELDQRCDELS
jgi:predicted RNase H-like nuclease (RuvC/YqgF family)